ncbi:MAG: TolC family protein, partial [Bacteroidales bacterium]|nr:TolC family protein [Bacteroidales bacterium]
MTELLKRANLFALFLLYLTLLPAQEIITIDECQQLAISQSSANVQKELNTQLLRVKLNDVSSHYYPTLEINGAVAYLSPVTELPTECAGFQKMDNDLYNVSLNFRQVVFDGMRATFGRKREKLLNKNEINKLDISINQIKEQVISIYLNLLIIEKQITILSSVENTFDEQSEQLKALLKAGVVYGNTIAQLELEGLKIQQQKD